MKRSLQTWCNGLRSPPFNRWLKNQRGPERLISDQLMWNLGSRCSSLLWCVEGVLTWCFFILFVFDQKTTTACKVSLDSLVCSALELESSCFTVEAQWCGPWNQRLSNYQNKSCKSYAFPFNYSDAGHNSTHVRTATAQAQVTKHNWQNGLAKTGLDQDQI